MYIKFASTGTMCIKFIGTEIYGKIVNHSFSYYMVRMTDGSYLEEVYEDMIEHVSEKEYNVALVMES